MRLHVLTLYRPQPSDQLIQRSGLPKSQPSESRILTNTGLIHSCPDRGGVFFSSMLSWEE